MAHSTSSLAGVNLTDTFASSGALPMNVGTVVLTTDGGQAMLVKAASTVAQYDCVSVITEGSATTVFSMAAVPLTITNAAASKRVGFAQTAITSAQYGWVHLEGQNLRCKVAIACAPAVSLYATATGGVLDDAISSAAGVGGVVAVTSAASASAVGLIVANPHISFLRDA